MSQIKIRFGVDEVTKTYSQNPTVGELKDDDNLRATLGYGDNVKALIDGVEADDDTAVGANQLVVIETAANHKA